MIYEFAGCRLDENTRSFTQGERVRHVQPKVFDALLFLLRNRSRVVSRDGLQRALWPGLAVSESALNRVVKEVRRVVGDDGRDQQIIRTRHTRGYQFVAEVSLSGDDKAREPLHNLQLARLSLEAAVELEAQDMRERIREFVSVCEDIVRRSGDLREPAAATGTLAR